MDQQELAQRAEIYFQMTMAFLSVGDWRGAADYLDQVRDDDGPQMLKNVTDMISVHLKIPPPEMR